MFVKQTTLYECTCRYTRALLPLLKCTHVNVGMKHFFSKFLTDRLPLEWLTFDLWPDLWSTMGSKYDKEPCCGISLLKYVLFIFNFFLLVSWLSFIFHTCPIWRQFDFAITHVSHRPQRSTYSGLVFNRLKAQDSFDEFNNSFSLESAGNHQKTPSDLPAIVF